ncbi:MAG: ABC transporter substrate-binding protein [Polyangiaceae bacterium]|jgi:ABC-type Fe3+-hydroxamate transport system substrate-binding protein|nr:ABC transporter substrate-binding protein [Polyangiaceae bacterium]MBK8941822.1 ABC transporter substrate-binding protein [Polyangiaceae bacterium]
MLITDDRGAPVRLSRAPSRIVSLVPSDTYTLLRLGAGERLVGRTRYCVEPASAVAEIPDVGGTKDPDMDRVLELEPDLVVMNREENTRSAYERLGGRGIAVLTTCPRTMSDGAAQVARLARLVGDLADEARSLVREAYQWLRRAAERDDAAAELAAFVPIWMDPLMTINGATFVSDALAQAGARNVFADRDRRFPLAADLGRGPEFEGARSEGRDTRYPRVTLDEVRERAPNVVLLPDEPHPFAEADADVFRALELPSLPPENVVFCSGKALMWPGLMSLERHDEIRALLERASRVARLGRQG